MGKLVDNRYLKAFSIFSLFIIMTSCKQKENNVQLEKSEIGRYQIVNDTKNDGVFWIDTATGNVQQCQWTDLDKGSWRCWTVKD